MDDKKIAVIIHKTNDKFCTRLIDSLQNLEVPDNYDVEILPVEGEEKFFAYDYAMKYSDAKYKIYIDEKVVVLERNILQRIVKNFQSDEKIGIIGVSGAIEFSTHGICLDSAKRCGKIFLTSKKLLAEWSKINEDYQEVEAVDGWFMATQYDFAWRHDLFHGKTYGESAQCIEFKRQGRGYKTVVVNQDTPYIWYSGNSFEEDEFSREIFLKKYSKDIFPLVTVIIPTFNRPEFFEMALCSAIAQTYKNIEIVISDNSTNDETENILPNILS